MNISTLIAVLILLLGCWVIAFPSDLLTLVARIKRGYRTYLKRKYGSIAYTHLVEAVRMYVRKKNLKSDDAEAFLRNHREELIEKYGTLQTDKRIGKPTYIEELF